MRNKILALIGLVVFIVALGIAGTDEMNTEVAQASVSHQAKVRIELSHYKMPTFVHISNK